MISRLIKYLLVLLLIASPGWGADLYVTQSGTGDGSSASTSASVAVFNAGTGNFATLDGDTVYFSGTITSTINTDDGGTAENRVILDFSNATLSITNDRHSLVIDEDYVTVRNAARINISDYDNAGDGIRINATADHTIIDGCTIVGAGGNAENTGHIGILIIGTNTTITNCDISHTTNGINIRGTDAGLGTTLIDSNTISYCRGNLVDDVANADGLIIGTDDAAANDLTGLTISNNTVTEWSDDGIDLYYGSNVIVEHNNVGPSTWDSALVLEGNGIKCGGNTGATGNVVRYNFVHDISHSGTSAINNAITGNYSDQTKIYGNLIVNSLNRGIYILPCDDPEIYNNTILNTTGPALRFQTTVTGGLVYNNILDGGDYDLEIYSDITGDYNVLVNDSGKSGTGTYTGGTHDLTETDPQLANGTYKPATYLIGTNIATVLTDINGNAKDAQNPQIGAVWLPSPVSAVWSNAVLSNMGAGQEFVYGTFE